MFMKQVKCWFNNRGRRQLPPPKFKAPRRVTVNQVLSRKYKDRIRSIATDLSAGARSGSQSHFGNWVRATEILKTYISPEELKAAEEERKTWESKGLPEDLKRHNAMKYGRRVLEQAAESEFKEIGMRSLRWEWRRYPDGQIMFHM